MLDCNNQSIPVVTPRRLRSRVAAALMIFAVAGAAVAAPGPRLPSGVDAAAVSADATSQPYSAQGRTTAGGSVHVLVELTEPSGVQAYVGAVPRRGGGGAPTTAQVAAATEAVTAAVSRSTTQQANFVNAARGASIQYTEIYRVQRVKNAIAMVVPQTQLAALRRLPGVKSVRPIVPATPNSLTSVPFTMAPEVWQGIPAAQADGAGVKIGIIDTGIDYQHANFGGPGTLAAYQDNDHVSTVGVVSGMTLFPTTKVAGGYDLAGDDYDANGVYGSTTPTPDNNPMDCNGHGSHVAGTAAGYGVTTAGTTYTGGYTTPIDPAGTRIYPGMAPNAKLYAFRVFGCGGSTDLVVEALDRAIDPNQDNDFSDHMDVVNMSLGSSFYGSNTADAEASEAASEVGVMVVASSGNSGDTYLVTGSPAAATRSLSVAASWDGGEKVVYVDTTASTPPTSARYFGVQASFGPKFPDTLLTDTAVVAAPLDGCTALTNGAAISGNIAIIKRGTCGFELKVKNAQDAGAIAVIMVNNVAGAPIVMGGASPPLGVTIPSVMISLADGTTLIAQAGSTTVTASFPLVSGGDQIADFSSRGPTNNTPIGSKPDITAPGLNVVSTQTGITCVTGGGCITPTATGYDENNQPLTISGTSMAAPHVAGMMALLRQLHPTFTVEELKALAMNGSLHDLYTAPGLTGLRIGGGRVGAGRIDAQISANLGTVAYNADGTGAVSITFPSEIFGTTQVTRTVHVVNHGTTAATYTLGFDNVVTNPGITFSLPGSASLTLPAGGSADVPVRMTGVANNVTHTFDPTIQASQLGNLRFFMTEATGYLTFKVAGDTKLRLPLYVAPYPAGDMEGSGIATGGAPSGTATITLSGTPVCSNVDCSVDTADDELGLVSPFELQVSNPRDAAIEAQGNVRHVGVSAGQGYLNFGVQVWGAGSVPGAPGYDVEITLVSPTGTALYTLYPYIAKTSAGDPTNVYFIGIYNYATQTTSVVDYADYLAPNQIDARLFQSDQFITGAPLTALGLTMTSKVRYFVDSFDGNNNLNEELGPFNFDLAAQGVDFGGAVQLDDVPGNTIPVTFNTANLAANASLGALLLHHHNRNGDTGQVITLQGGAPVLSTVASRKVHGAAGTFDLPLAVTGAATIEPRSGPNYTVVFTFDKPVTAATAAVVGTVASYTLTYAGNEVQVNLNGVADMQYVQVTLSAVTATDGGTGGTGGATVGILAGDVTQNHLVSVADMGFINSMLAQPVTSANFLMDVNASGVISTGDLGVTNSNLTHSLPTN